MVDQLLKGRTSANNKIHDLHDLIEQPNQLEPIQCYSAMEQGTLFPEAFKLHWFFVEVLNIGL